MLVGLFYWYINLFMFLFKLTLIPTKIQSFFEFLIGVMFDMFRGQLGSKLLVDGVFFFPFFFTVFFFVLTYNLLGLLPFGFTITAHIIITFFFALLFNLSFFFVGLYMHSINFFLLFVPRDAPFALIPLIVVIEILSYLIRSFSLSLRLFANMMAGHCLLHVLSLFFFKLYVQTFLFFLGLIFVIFCVFILEFVIALLQTYVFVMLLLVYLTEALALH